MKTTPAFWDASAIAPLCVHQSSSGHARTLLRRFALVVWWGTPVELHSAISRLRRSGELSEPEKQGAIARLNLLAQSWREVLPDDAIRALAGECLDRYPLRAADAVQLAAALTWCNQRPARRHFICADERIGLAAKSAGFSILQLTQSP